MIPDREGRFKSTILEHGVSETGPNKLATFVCRFQLSQELIGDDWEPVDQDFDITGYFYLEKRDGALNTITIDNLKTAFGWDGRDPFWLQDADLSQLIVQVKLAYDTYDGKTRLKVQYVNAENATPTSVPIADDTTRRSIGTRLGSKFRANAGGTPTPAPMPSGSSPVPSKPAPVKPAVPVSQTPMEHAWEAFGKACPTSYGSEAIEAEWFRLLGLMFPGRRPEQLIPADWVRFTREAPAQVIPF